MAESKSTTTPKSAPATAEDDDAPKSVQSHFSTYTENPDAPETNPPSGRAVVQERGTPSEGEVKAFGA